MINTRWAGVTTSLIVALAVGQCACKRSRDDGTSRTAPAASSQAAAGGAAAEDEDERSEHHPAGTPRVRGGAGEQRTTADGREVLHLGKELTGATGVSVSQLLDDADAWIGKRVALEGDVAGMCDKRRRWFALVDQGTGQHIRLFTVPVFLVPRDAVGKSVRAEGVVARVEIPAVRARHISKVHKLGDPEAITGKVHRELVVRVDVAQLW